MEQITDEQFPDKETGDKLTASEVNVLKNKTKELITDTNEKSALYIVDINFLSVEDYVFKAPENMIITFDPEPGVTHTLTGYTEGEAINKYDTFTISVNVPGMVTLRGVIQ